MTLPLPRSGFFLTGSDTDVGKTHVGCQIIRQLKHRVPSLKVRKPVESGCKTVQGKLFPADGDALYRCNDELEELQIITPYRFAAALAPDQAARLENRTLSLSQLEQAVWQNTEENDFLLVEGAGGFYSPIAEDGLNADLAHRLGLPLILVIEDRLGAINQALLTVRAAQAEGLEVRAVILNRRSRDASLSSNLESLRQHLEIPLHRCPFQQVAADFDLLG